MSNTVKQLGFIPTNRGEFDTTGQTRYYKDNVVQYRNGSYICSPVGYSSSNPTAYTTDAPYQDGDTQLNPNWELMASVGLVDEEPVAGSDNLIKSGGVYNFAISYPAYGKALNTLGELVNEPLWFVKKYVIDTPIQEGDVIVWSGIASDAFKCICFYDNNGTFMNARSATGSSRTITVSSGDPQIGATIIKASFLKSSESKADITLNGIKLNSVGNVQLTSEITNIDNDTTAPTPHAVNSRVYISKILGNGSNFVFETHKLTPNHTYKLTHLNYVWNISETISTMTIFSIENYYNGQSTNIYRILKNNTSFVAKEYQFTVPTNSDYIQIGGRANHGDNIFYQLEDITEILPLKKDLGESKIGISELLIEPGTIGSDNILYFSNFAARCTDYIHIKETPFTKKVIFKITDLFTSLISEIQNMDTLGINVAYYNANKQFIKRLTDRCFLNSSNSIGEYPLLEGTEYVKFMFFPLNGTTNIDVSSIDPSRKILHEIVTTGVEISYNDYYSIEKTEVSATIIKNTNVDTLGTGQIDNAIRYRYVYNNCIQRGDIINIKAKNGYKIDVVCYFGELHLDNTNAWAGQVYSDSGWQQAISLKVMNDAVNSITINTKRDDGAVITHYDIIENIEICVFRGGESKGTYSYSGKKIKIDTTPTFDGFNYMNISYSGASGQGAAIYGDYFIQGGAGGHIKIFDLKEKTTVVNDITLGSAGTGNHCNNISIGVERANDGVFPYIYISECNGNTRRCFVENLTLEDSTLVQTIVYSGTKYLNNAADHDWVVDRENELLYAIGNTKSAYNVSGNMIGITKFRLPKISEGSSITLTDSEVLDYFELDGSEGKLYVYQGSCVFNGNIYFAIGGSVTSHRFVVINPNTHIIETVVELDTMYSAGEPESINIYKDSIFIGYPNQQKLYLLSFK